MNIVCSETAVPGAEQDWMNRETARGRRLTRGIGPDRCGCIVASGIGGLSTIASEHVKGMEKGYSRISPFFIPMSISNMAAGQIALRHGLKGICTCIVTACASSKVISLILPSPIL